MQHRGITILVVSVAAALTFVVLYSLEVVPTHFMKSEPAVIRSSVAPVTTPCAHHEFAKGR